MSDWYVGYLKGAADRGGPARASDWAKAEAVLGEAPGELKELWGEANGARLAGNVELHPLTGVVSATRHREPAFPHAKPWVFGRRREQVLFATRRGDVAVGGKAPAWLKTLPADAWVWGRWDSSQGERLYVSLETLLEVLVPPTETEDFGENTFARALSAVERAVGALKASDSQPEMKPIPRKKAPGKKGR